MKNFKQLSIWKKFLLIAVLITAFIIIIWAFYIKPIGWLLDKEAERAVEQEYVKNDEGIIKIAIPKSFENGHNKALVLIPGHMETPHTYYELFEKAKQQDAFDIYLPNIPYHTQTLQKARELDNEVVLNYFEQYIRDFSNKYKKITVVAFSYGGLIFANLLKENKIPKNVEVILYAPAIYIKANSDLNYQATYWLPLLFRNYYNYDLPPFLPTAYPVYESGDEMAKDRLENEVGFRYRVFEAIHEMFVLDRNSEEIIKNISTPFKLLIAKDDNRIPYEKLKDECASNDKCEFISFSSGKHVIHYGKRKDEFLQTISNISLED
jgi:esterase/lipase